MYIKCLKTDESKKFVKTCRRGYAILFLCSAIHTGWLKNKTRQQKIVHSFVMGKYIAKSFWS